MDIEIKQKQETDASLIASTADGELVSSATLDSLVSAPIESVEPQDAIGYCSGSQISSQDIMDLNDDTSSVRSEKSGLTDIAKEVQKLELGQKTTFVHLNRSEKRFFQKTLRSGKTREEALEMVRAMKDEPSKKPEPTVKRIRSEESPAESNSKKACTSANRISANRPTYKAVLGSVRLGFVPTDLADKPLKQEQFTLIKEAVLEVMMDSEDNATRPEFESIQPRNGWVLITCTNSTTASWVRKMFDAIRAKSNLDLTLVEEGDLPKNHIVRGFFPDSLTTTNIKVLKMISVQNGLSATSWKVLQRKTEGKYLHLVLNVDDASYERLKRDNGRIAYQFGHLYLILKGVKLVGTQDNLRSEQKVPKKPIRTTEADKAGPSGTVTVPPRLRPPLQSDKNNKLPRAMTKSNRDGATGKTERVYRDKGPRKAQLQRQVANSANRHGQL